METLKQSQGLECIPQDRGGDEAAAGDAATMALKQRQFNAAMALYTTRPIYRCFGIGVSLVNISLQLLLAGLVLQHPLPPARQLIALGVAWLLADFVNGLVHMYMDNNDRYDSAAGPLIANFHLHHRTPQYRKRPLAVVYFIESGSKIWLAGYLAAVAGLLVLLPTDPLVAHILLYVGILSSIAEVSHYLCHTSVSPLATLLAQCGLLLSKRHHARHHLQDNANYAFLNGWSDPLLNWIARACYPGYKRTTDRHFARYTPEGDDTRR